jgi:hypothetical protein
VAAIPPPKRVEKKTSMPLSKPETTSIDRKRLMSEDRLSKNETPLSADSQSNVSKDKVYIKPRPKSPTKAVTPGVLARQEERDKKKEEEKAAQAEAEKALA